MTGQISDRRQNWQLRKLISCAYALSLLVGTAGPALAEDAYAQLWLGKLLSGKNTPTTPQHQSQTVPRLVFFSFTGTHDANAWLREDLATRSALDEPYRQQALAALNALDPAKLVYQNQPLRKIRDGFGFDFQVADGGALHFNLYSRRNARTEGLRVALNSVGNEPAHKRWSVGASLDPVQTEDGERKIAIVPQLLLDLDGLFSRIEHFEAAVEYGHWRGGKKKVALDTQVAQLVVRLRF